MFLCFLGAASLAQKLGQVEVYFRQTKSVPSVQLRGIVPKLIVDCQGFAESNLRLAGLSPFAEQHAQVVVIRKQVEPRWLGLSRASSTEISTARRSVFSASSSRPRYCCDKPSPLVILPSRAR